MGKVTKTFVIGATIGAITALLLTPRTGKQTQKILKDKYKEIYNHVEKQLSRIKKLTSKEYKTIVAGAMKLASKTETTKEELADIHKHLMEQWKILQQKFK